MLWISNNWHCTHVDSCAQLARHSTGRRRHSGVELTCAMQDQSPPNPVPGLGSRCCLLRVALRSVFFFKLWVEFFCRGLVLHRRVSNLERPCSGPAFSGPVKLRHGRAPPPALAECFVWSALHLSGFAELLQKHDQSRCVHRRGLLMSRLGKIIF